MIKAVVFDLDDTLTPEIEYVKSGYRHVAELLSGILTMESEHIFRKLMELFKMDPKRVFNRFFEKLGYSYSQSDIVFLVESYRNHIPTIQFYDDVIPCLRKLRCNGIKTGVITDGYKCTQWNKLRALDAEHYFDHIIVTDELGRKYWKPHPMAFELMKGQLDVKFHELIYVGDNPEKDFYIGKLCGVKTVRIYRPGLYRGYDYRADIREEYSIYSLSELGRILKIE